jgi:hypothetical protein
MSFLHGFTMGAFKRVQAGDKAARSVRPLDRSCYVVNNGIRMTGTSPMDDE